MTYDKLSVLRIINTALCQVRILIPPGRMDMNRSLKSQIRHWHKKMDKRLIIVIV